MMRIVKLKDLSQNEIKKIIERGKIELESVLENVKKIVEDVKNRGDEALKYYTKKFDGVEIDNFIVDEEEVEKAKDSVDYNFINSVEKAYENIKYFHERQLINSWFYVKDSAKLGFIVKPIKKVGCYVPGGKAAYPSTVLMLSIPARVAGVRKIFVATPPEPNKYILATCDIVGVDRIYKVGGAQAISALAYGTESVEKVEKIVGPGNIYVTAAKKIVSDDVAIDMIAGPSEVLIIADGSANPRFIALDMIAQAEHDENAVALLITDSEELANKVYGEVMSLLNEAGEIAKKSIEKNAYIILADSIEEAVEFTNEYAPEHLEIMCKNGESILDSIENAGSIFIGEYTPVACGDYASGTNHVLPTSGYAKIYSALSVFDFLKFMYFQKFNEKSLREISDAVINLAKIEGLYMHARSVEERLKKKN